MIVVDVGCKSHENERSIEPLIERFHPRVLYGFDPHPQTQPERTQMESGTLLVVERKAAWTFDGTIPYLRAGSSSRVGYGDDTVECFDLAAFVEGVLLAGGGDPVVVKLDCEGAEFPLLADLDRRLLLSRLELLLVEWHIPCPWEAW